MNPPMTMSFVFRLSPPRVSPTHRTNHIPLPSLIGAKVTIDPEGFTRLLALLYPGGTEFPPLKVLDGITVEYREIAE